MLNNDTLLFVCNLTVLFIMYPFYQNSISLVKLFTALFKTENAQKKDPFPYWEEVLLLEAIGVEVVLRRLRLLRLLRRYLTGLLRTTVLRRHLTGLLRALRRYLTGLLRATVLRRHLTGLLRATVLRRYLTGLLRATVLRRYLTGLLRTTVLRRYLTGLLRTRVLRRYLTRLLRTLCLLRLRLRRNLLCLLRLCLWLSRLRLCLRLRRLSGLLRRLRRSYAGSLTGACAELQRVRRGIGRRAAYHKRRIVRRLLCAAAEQSKCVHSACHSAAGETEHFLFELRFGIE